MPRAALVSIHARVEGTEPSTWEDSSLVQLWGPRHHAYVIPARDLAVFSLGRLPDEGGALRVAEDLAARLHLFLSGARMTYGEAGRAVGDSWILTSDEPAFRAARRRAASARLLPSGDAYFLLQGGDRELLVPDASRRRALWTPRVWPGAVLVDGEIVGTWRRALGTVTIEAWRRLTRAARDAVETEAASLPLPEIQGRVVTRWDG